MGACCCLFFFTYNLIRFVYNSMYKCPSASDFFEFNCYLHPKQHCISIWSLTFSVSKFCIAISALDIDHIDNSHNKFCLFLLQWKYVCMMASGPNSSSSHLLPFENEIIASKRKHKRNCCTKIRTWRRLLSKWWYCVKCVCSLCEHGLTHGYPCTCG